MKQILYYTRLVFFILISHQSYATWTIDSLSGNRAFMASITVGTKAIFSNGYNWEIFEETTHQWTSGNFFMARNDLYPVANGDKAYFAGGWRGPSSNPVDVKNIEVFNAVTGTWSGLNLSQARRVGGAAAVGNKVIFAGGYKVLAYSNRVDIFDVQTNLRTTALLSQARTAMSVGVSGDKVLFAGGQKGQSTMGIINSSDRVDIYDNALNTWSIATLSSKRQHMGVAVVGNKILFAGGINMSTGLSTSNVDIYDISTNTWSVQQISQKKYAMTSAVVGTKAYFFGGIVNSAGMLSSRAEIYDVSTGLWTVKYLTGPHHAGVVTVTGDRIMYSGGIEAWGNIGTAKIEVLTIASNTWTVEQLSEPRLYLSSASFPHTAVIAGGVQVWSSYPLYTIPSKRVDIWTDNAALKSFSNMEADSSALQLSVYPNPAKEYLHVQVSGPNIGQLFYQIYNVNGQLMFESTATNNPLNDIELFNLPQGLYFLRVQTNTGEETTLQFLKN